MKILLSILCCILSISNVFAQSAKSAIDSMRMELQQYMKQQRGEFETYEAQAKADYEKYRDNILNIWGGDTIVDNTKKDWVEYDKDYKSRSIVDFEKGNIKVEVTLDDTEIKDKQAVNDKLAKSIERMLNSRGSTCPYQSKVDKDEPLTKKPILDNIVDLSKYNISENDGKKKSTPSKEKSKAGNSTIAKKVAQQSKKTVTTTIGKDGKKRQVVQIEMNLVADNLSKNAKLYKDIVAEFSQKFNIEQPLIFAVMEVESYFNPKATSYVPAYGLMQLVPTTGATDAYSYVYKKKWTPSKSYLYNPRNNIELGTAYLRVLMNYFSSVTDPHCRRLCVIASYNTGAGNVSRAFTGNTNLKKALPHINKYEYNRLYNYLVTKLHHQEARNYVKKVSEKREKYIKK